MLPGSAEAAAAADASVE